MGKRFKEKKAAVITGVLVISLMMAVMAVVLAGCGNDTQSKQQQFKAQWVKIIEQLQARISLDDKKGQDLVAKNDLPGVITLTKQRVANINETLGKVLQLYPPNELRKLDVLSAYYLITLQDRLQQQISLYDAILNNRPTADIITVLNELTARNQTISRELGIELQKDGITIGPSNGKPTTTPSSTPSSTPGK
jgi:hypothetical protein